MFRENKRGTWTKPEKIIIVFSCFPDDMLTDSMPHYTSPFMMDWSLSKIESKWISGHGNTWLTVILALWRLSQNELENSVCYLVSFRHVWTTKESLGFTVITPFQTNINPLLCPSLSYVRHIHLSQQLNTLGSLSWQAKNYNMFY